MRFRRELDESLEKGQIKNVKARNTSYQGTTTGRIKTH